MGSRVAVVAVFLVAAACARTLPEHDNRIFTAVPVAKLSAADLAAAFGADRSAADARFAGRAIEVSGVIRGLPTTGAEVTFSFQPAEGAPVVHVSLHEDRATEIVKGLTDGTRVTLKCFCEGATDGVQLKSCVVP